MFVWTPGTGYRAAYELAILDPSGDSTDAGMLASEVGYRVQALCGSRVDFTLIALEASGSEELGRWPVTFAADPCPGRFVVSGGRATAAAGGAATATASCPTGSAVVGGGFAASAGTAAMPYPGWVYASERSGNGWVARLLAPPERSLSLFVRVVCLAHLESEGHSAQVEVPAGRLRSVVASCPLPLKATGGGFSLDRPGPNVLVSTREGEGWRVTAYNGLTVPVMLRADVTCVDEPWATVTEAEATALVPDGGTSSNLGVSCPAGSTLTGGGFASADAVFEWSVPAESAARWVAGGHNQAFSGPSGPAVQVEVSAVCVRFP
jgi:hypothetical protein